MSKIEYIVNIGDVFDSWAVIGILPKKYNCRNIFALCECKVCFNRVSFSLSNLLKNKCKKCTYCNQILREKRKRENELDRIHKKNSRVVWSGMITRTTDKKYRDYHRYGGRGILVCDRWKKFENFYEDMGDRPKNKSLDRVDNNGNYCKENCRWATRKEQANNRRNNVYYYFKNKRMTQHEWALEFLVDDSSVEGILNKKGVYRE